MGRSRGWGMRCQRPPTPGGAKGVDAFVLFALLFGHALSSVCPSLALLPPGGFEFEGAEGSSWMLGATLRVRGCMGF